MNLSPFTRRAVIPGFLVLLISFAISPDRLPPVQSRMSALPAITLWSWERREDMRRFDASRYSIAYLDQTLTIDLNLHRETRRNPVELSDGATRIPVVRIEPSRHAVLDAVNREQTVRAILLSAKEPGIAALQIDFDAKASERPFYRDLLIDVRRQMPPTLPLSITALASWCSYDDWLSGLPIDEAVPMMFRMEPDRRQASAVVNSFINREPLCQGAVGVSTSEPWPARMENKRVYLFADRGWHAEKLASPEWRVE